MTIKEYVLDGLEAELELERELGIRSFEIDRGLLAVAHASNALPSKSVSPSMTKVSPLATHRDVTYDFIFLHDRQFSLEAQEMMAKIVHAMGKDKESAPILFAGPLPKAKITIVLGGRALKKFFPLMRGEPGQMAVSDEGRLVCITYSPEYILKFGTVTPVVDKLKHIMWGNLKSVMQRVR